jgi:hypothetical protein
MSQGSSVDTAKGYRAGVRFSAGATDFTLLLIVQTGSEAHITSYPMGTGSLFPGVKAARV